MEYSLIKSESLLTVKFKGELSHDSYTTIVSLLNDSMTGIDYLQFDLKDVTYLTSGGLRSLLHAQNMMSDKGKFSVINANSDVKDVIDCAGFSLFMDIA